MYDYNWWVILFFLIVILIIYKKYFFQDKRAIQVDAKIEKIKIHHIDDIWSPELEIYYFFYFNNKKYQNKAFVSIDYFLEENSFLLENRNSIPTLILADKEFIGEEHIEAYLTSLSQTIPIEFNSLNPSIARINQQSQKKYLLQEVDITFPWLK